MNRRKIGSDYENAVAKALENHGYQILQRNFRNRFGEIDLIALSDGYLVFIEVKYRKDENMGWPEEAVDIHKQQNICRVADYFLLRYPEYREYPIRFDVATVLGRKFRLYYHAFEYQRRPIWK